MNLYFIRHEQAEDVAVSRKDFDRNLTPFGIKRLQNSLKYWENFVKFDIILSSPYNRALQTAEIISKHFNVDLVIHKELSCGASTNQLLELLENYQEYKNIVIVGHEPDLSSIISDLCANSFLKINIKKGSITKLSFFNTPKFNNGILEFYIPAKIFWKK